MRDSFYPGNSEKLQLLGNWWLFLLLVPIKDAHHTKLLVGNGQNPHMTFGRQAFLNSPDVHIGIFTAGAVPQIGAELKHGEAVLHHTLSEVGVILPVFLGFHRQIEKDHDPHNSVFVEAHSS